VSWNKSTELVRTTVLSLERRREKKAATTRRKGRTGRAGEMGGEGVKRGKLPVCGLNRMEIAGV
jgi:hypothetical protein